MVWMRMYFPLLWTDGRGKKRSLVGLQPPLNMLPGPTLLAASSTRSLLGVCWCANGSKHPSCDTWLSPACCVWAVWTHWQIWLQAILDAISRNRILSLMRRKKLSGLWGTEKNRKVPKQKEKPARDKDKERALYCHTGRVLRKKVKLLHHLHQHSGYAAVFSWIIGVAAQTKPPHQCWYRRRKSQNQKSRKF